MITLGKQQTRLCAELSRIRDLEMPDLLPLSPIHYKQAELQLLAEQVKQSYEENRGSDYGFSFDPQTGRFVSIHLYLAAVRFLEDGLRE